MNQFKAVDLTCVRGQKRLFQNKNLTLNAGATLIVRGSNGSGKTSLLRLLAGLSKPDTGQILCNGHSIFEDLPAYHRRLHYLGHENALKPALTIRENLNFTAKLWNSPSSSIDNALEQFDLTYFSNRQIRLLSIGQKRRIALLRLLLKPSTSLWILDEPTAGLDKKTVTIFKDILKRHCNNGGLTIIAQHGEPLVPEAKILEL